MHDNIDLRGDILAIKSSSGVGDIMLDNDSTVQLTQLFMNLKIKFMM